MDDLDREVGAILSGTDGRAAKADRIADAIRRAGAYRWVGIYEVDPEEIAIMGWSGPGPPEHPRFPVAEGLCGAAVAQRATVVVGDVSADPRYLATLGTTRSEIVVPAFSWDGERVMGLIDVESQHRDAFSDADRGLLERCARAIAPLWG
jgi:GAF domain-containing protein